MGNKNDFIKQLLASRFFLIFYLLVILQLTGIVFNVTWLRLFSKPLLMPVLALAIYQYCKPVAGKWLMIIALLFSWAGDCFLMWEAANAWFFIAGLASFLITHILYIYYFLQKRKTQKSILYSRPVLVLMVLAYTAGLLWILYPGLGNLKIPVLLYAIVIASMLLAAIHAYSSMRPLAGKLFVSGAVLFILSDSMLAINKFLPAFAGASFLIMITYCAAQFCIVIAFLRQQHD